MCYNHDESLTPEEAESLEKEFRAAVEAQSLIQTKLNQMQELMDECKKLSNNSGVPFNVSYVLNGASNTYVPKAFESKRYNLLDLELISDLTDAYPEEGDWWAGGWQKSYC